MGLSCLNSLLAMPSYTLPDTEHITAFRRDGAVVLRGLIAEHVDTLRAGVERNLAKPGQYAAENLQPGEGGRFFDDYCNWTRIPEFESVIRDSALAEAGADRQLLVSVGSGGPGIVASGRRVASLGAACIASALAG